MNIETKWLEDFLSLADTQSFSRSAEERFVTQPAFSRRIRSLEDVVGCELIDRSQQPVQLTPAGKLFRITARNLIEQLKGSITHMQALNQRTEAVIDFALSHSLSLSFFPKFVQDSGESLRGIRSRQLVANVDDSVQALKNGICDFLLAFHDVSLEGQRFQHLSLRKDKLIPVCQTNDNGEPRYLLDTDDKKDIPYLTYPQDIYLGRRVGQLISRTFPQSALSPCFESPLADSLKLMAMQGMGVAWVPGFIVDDELRQGYLVQCGDQRWEIPLSINLYRCNRPLSASAEKVWTTLSERYSMPEIASASDPLSGKQS
ncbi:LysR family transcriptional regulator [Motiliproteus sp. MSK22-1]|uniref:LysR family transcriptional regulator n=1 Tax=Motiliproteus sp. MSK22-1 TaxID=1897630 RepID=UPI0009770C78|nr:LysR family transcriptional regulator [Motiliproteus sp. MSK22-1]OMH29454.1 LysR family transcriptional regulator [Motiliproteus sp. MSK22-1]